MHDGDIVPFWQGALLLSLAAAMLYGLHYVRQTESARRSVAKSLAVGLCAALSFELGGPALLTAALVLSTLGDFFLSRDGERNFLLGLAAFLLAHVAYVLLFASIVQGDPASPNSALGAISQEAWRWILALLALAGAVAMLRFLWPHLGALRLPVVAYVLAISAMVVTALALPVPPYGLATAGALMFAASDAILSVETFVLQPDDRSRTWTAEGVWWLYYCGQVLIAVAMLGLV